MIRFLIFSFFLCILSCNNDKTTSTSTIFSIKDYYFPVENLIDGLVYEYRALNNDSIGAYYWLYRTVKQDGETYLVGQNYDQNFNIQQMMTEDIGPDGSILKNFFYYSEPNEAGIQNQIPIKIESPNVYPFNVVKDGNAVLYQVKYTEPENPEATTTLIRKRRYLGKKDFNYKGKNLDCVQFELKEIVDNEEIGHLEFEFEGIELYAKGIGLVYYKKNVSEDHVLEYALTNTFSVKELENKYGATLEQQ